MKHLISSLVLLGLLCSSPLSAQKFKDKMKAKFSKKKTVMYECGYVHKEGLGAKINPMKMLQKGLIAGMSKTNNTDLENAAITVFYQAHMHPQGIMKYPTKTPGWETCGDAVFASFTKNGGSGVFGGTDGAVLMGTDTIRSSGAGTYFQGFSPEERSIKEVSINSSSGDLIKLSIPPGEFLEIVSVDGKKKGEEVSIDGTKDIVIELDKGDADPNSMLHVQLICKLVGQPIIYDLVVVKAQNTIRIPKESFKNFEGSPSPFSSSNTLIVNRVSETLIDNTDAGALRTISAYMDWMPLSIEGDLSKGNALTMGFDTTKTTSISIDFETKGEYNFSTNKSTPFYSPPTKMMKDIAIASFVVRGNLVAKKRETSTTSTWEITKWFPEFKEETWQSLANKMHADLESNLKNEFDFKVRPLSEVIQSEAYIHAKPILDTVTQNYVEVGAGGTKRILSSTSSDLWTDWGFSFPADFISERLIKELGVNTVIAVSVDLNLNIESEAVDPIITIEAYAPNLSYKTPCSYFKIKANTEAIPFSNINAFVGGYDDVLYEMIKAKEFSNGFMQALKKLQVEEGKYPVYDKLWDERF